MKRKFSRAAAPPGMAGVAVAAGILSGTAPPAASENGGGPIGCIGGCADGPGARLEAMPSRIPVRHRPGSAEAQRRQAGPIGCTSVRGASTRAGHPLHVVLRRRARCTKGRASTSERRNTVRRISLILLAVMAGGMTLAGCSSPTVPPGPLGTVAGKLQAVGGSPGTGPQALAGQITLHGPNGLKFPITAGADGRFSVPVTVGTYTVTARSPQFEGGSTDCTASAPVTVTQGATSSVVVDCQEK